MQQGTPGNFGNFPGTEQGSLTSVELEPYMLEAYLRKKTQIAKKHEIHIIGNPSNTKESFLNICLGIFYITIFVNLDI